MKTVLVELHYLPCIAYFSALQNSHHVVVEKYEHYQKQSYRNRCYVKGAHQIETLIIPVSGKHGKPEITQVKPDYNQKWLNNHWRTIEAGYRKAPFYEYYAPDLHQVLFSQPESLYDLNLRLVTMCLKWLKMDVTLSETSGFQQVPQNGVFDLRGWLNPKKEDSCNRFYKSVEYSQVFGSKFVPNLSLIDLVFCQGPGASDIVRASAVNEQ